MTRLAANVTVTDPVTFVHTTYFEGEEPSAEHAKLITNPKAWEGGEVPEAEDVERPADSARVDKWRAYAEHLGLDLSASAKKADIVKAVDEHEAGQVERPDADADEDAWRAYAEHLELGVDGDASKDDIIAAVEAHEAR